MPECNKPQNAAKKEDDRLRQALKDAINFALAASPDWTIDGRESTHYGEDERGVRHSRGTRSWTVTIGRYFARQAQQTLNRHYDDDLRVPLHLPCSRAGLAALARQLVKHITTYAHVRGIDPWTSSSRFAPPREATLAEVERAELALHDRSYALLGQGMIGRITVLIRRWFPSHAIRVLDMGRDEEGYLKYDLVVTFGQGEHATSYMRGFSWKSIAESSLGTAIGALEHAHKVEEILQRALKDSEAIDSAAERKPYQWGLSKAILAISFAGWQKRTCA